MWVHKCFFGVSCWWILVSCNKRVYAICNLTSMVSEKCSLNGGIPFTVLSCKLCNLAVATSNATKCATCPVWYHKKWGLKSDNQSSSFNLCCKINKRKSITSGLSSNEPSVNFPTTNQLDVSDIHKRTPSISSLNQSKDFSHQSSSNNFDDILDPSVQSSLDSY